MKWKNFSVLTTTWNRWKSVDKTENKEVGQISLAMLAWCIQQFDRPEMERSDGENTKMFTLKKWNAVAMWSWDVECDTCAICRVQVMDACLRCQAESKQDSRYGKQDCVVVWGDCNHSFHYCCMSLWVKQNNRCPLCQQEWSIQRMGK